MLDLDLLLSHWEPLTALAATIISPIAAWLATRRRAHTEALRVYDEYSTKQRIAELEDQRAFREELMEQVRQLRGRLAESEARCSDLTLKLGAAEAKLQFLQAHIAMLDPDFQVPI